MNSSRKAQDHDKDQPLPVCRNAHIDLSIEVSLVLTLQQFVSHLSPALVLVLSIGLGAVSYSVFIRLTQKEEIGEIRELIGV
jgi:hypothetical protein